MKNKYGYYPSDIALNLKVRDLLMQILIDKESEIKNAANQKYGRTAFNGVLRHNDRVNMV